MTAVRERLGPRRRSIWIFVTLALMAAALVIVLPATASHPEVSLAGSNFEIDTDANLKLNTHLPRSTGLASLKPAGRTRRPAPVTIPSVTEPRRTRPFRAW